MIIGIFESTPISIFIKEAGLRPAESLLNSSQQKYAQRPLELPTDDNTRKILLETSCNGDAHTKSVEQEQNYWDWLSEKKAKNLGQRLANSLIKGTELDKYFVIEKSERILDN